MKLCNFYTRSSSDPHLGAVIVGRVDLTEASPTDPQFASVSAMWGAGKDSFKRAQQRIAEDPSRAMARTTPDEVDYAPLVDGRSRIFCVGLNYADHAAENNLSPPESPISFAKLASVAVGHNRPIPLPIISEQVDYEVSSRSSLDCLRSESLTLTLEPADVISMGTPSGIGYANPKVFLRHGDVVEVEVEGVGILRNTVIKQEEMDDSSGKGRRR